MSRGCAQSRHNYDPLNHVPVIKCVPFEDYNHIYYLFIEPSLVKKNISISCLFYKIKIKSVI